MTDGYAGEIDEEFSKQIGTNFCSILWAGVSEHDIPLLYYFYNACQNHVPAENPMREEMMLNLSKRLVGMASISENLAGKSSSYSLPTSVFQSQQQITVIRNVFPYSIVISCARPCSERTIINLLNYVTLITFLNSDSENPEQQFTPHHKQVIQPQQPCQSFDEIKNYLNGLLLRFFEDETGREYINNYHPLYIPKDIISPYLQALQIIKQLQKHHQVSTSCITLNGRMILSTAGPIMTNIAALITNTHHNDIYNKKLHYIFKNYFQNESVQSKYQKDNNYNNLQFCQYSTIYMTVFRQNQMCAVLFSSQQTSLKPNMFNLQLQQLNEKLQVQQHTPPVFTSILNQTHPTFVPVPGVIDVCGIDAAGAFRGLRGVQNLQQLNNKIDYGTGVLDGTFIQYFHERHVCDCQVISQQEEKDIGRNFEKQGEFYSFNENKLRQTCLLSGGIKQMHNIITHYQADDEFSIETIGAAPLTESSDCRTVLKAIQELAEIYIRVSWG